MGKTIESQTIPPATQQPKVEFREDDFDFLVYSKGYEVLHERSIPCPCKTKGGDNLSTCRNCLGVGWIFLNPVQTRMVLQGMNKSTKYKEWSKELIGSVSVTARSEDELSFMDRITVPDSVSTMGQVLYPIQYDGNLFSYTIYDIKEVIDCFMFDSDETKLKRISSTQFSVDRNIIIFDSGLYKENLKISVRYRHPLQFHLIDMSNDIRRSNKFTGVSDLEEMNFPYHAVGKRAHYVLDSNNYAGTLIIFNE